MLLRWDIEKPGQFQLLPTPLPTWEGVQYVDSAALPTFRTGDGFGVAKAAAPPLIPPALAINPFNIPSTGSAQILTGTVTAGITPVVSISSPALAGAVSVNGTNWSCPLSGLAKGDNSITVTATDGSGNIAVRTTQIALVVPDGNFKGSGSTDVSDALRALRIGVGLVTPSFNDLLHGDVSPLVNGAPAPDGSIGVADALTILRKVVGLVNF